MFHKNIEGEKSMWNNNFNTHEFFEDFELKKSKGITELTTSYTNIIAQIAKSYKLQIKEQMAKFDSDINI